MTTLDRLPPPLVPPDIDLRDMPLPRDFFINMAVAELGMERHEAVKLVNEICDSREGKSRRRKRKTKTRS